MSSTSKRNAGYQPLPSDPTLDQTAESSFSTANDTSNHNPNTTTSNGTTSSGSSSTLGDSNHLLAPAPLTPASATANAPTLATQPSQHPPALARTNTASAGVPPKIIPPSKQAFPPKGSVPHPQQPPMHSQIPGAAQVAAKSNAAARAAAAAAASNTGASTAKGFGSTAGGTGFGSQLPIGHSSHPGMTGNIPGAGSYSHMGSSSGSIPPQMVNQRGKVKQPMRTTKTSQKLTLFPEEKEVPVLEDEIGFDDTTYNQIGQLSSGTARFDAHRLSKLDRQKLPRVIAYCTAASYRMDDLFNYLQSRKVPNGAAPKLFDECIYTPFSFSTPTKPPTTADLLGLDESVTNPSQGLLQQTPKELLPEVFFFDYGVVVIWGMTELEEKRLLQELSRFEQEKLAEDDVETEEFCFHYNSSYQPRIYNDVITLKSPGNYMVKLTISHAIAQSVKMTLFEGLIENTINATKHIPQQMAETGKVTMSSTQITKKIGQLFIMRINVNLVSNILDTPEIFWSEPSFQPLYSAIRGYLEINQRVELLNQRTTVISDLLDMLKEHLTSSHGEQLEWIVIILIFFEIVIGVITICLDAFSYSRGGK
ncbi:hypothetical protein BGW42_004285 [Actinomortierella wolfii]|nr:hypothetical protein BGW42_004285 [Actinomortierella wolfii]